MLRTILLGVVAILLLSTGQTLLKLGLNQIGGVSLTSGLQAVGKLLQTPWVALGLFFYMASTVLWLDVLSKLDFSMAFPMMGLNYVFVLLIGHFVFHEPVGLTRIMGVVLILTGIFVLVRSPVSVYP